MKKRPFGRIILLLPILGWFLLALDDPDFHDPRLLREPIPATRLSNKDYATMLEAHGWPAAMLNTAADNDYQGRTADIGHDGQGGMQARIEREGKWFRRIAENITYGFPSAHYAVLALMIDDGVPGRGHRISMLDPELKVVGAAWSTHPKYLGGLYVMKYAGGFTEK